MEAGNKFGALNCECCANIQTFGHLGKCCETRNSLGRSAFVFPSTSEKLCALYICTLYYMVIFSLCPHIALA